MVAPITVRPIIPLGPDTIIEGNPYQIAGRPTPQPVSATVAPVGNMGLGGYTPQQSANVTNLLRAALPVQQSAPALPAMPASSLMGLFRDRNPLAQGLLAAGKALTDYGAPSTMPKGGFMGALGAGGQGFVTGYQAGEDANIANRLAAYKLITDARQKQFAVGNRVYDPNTGRFISPTGTGASAQPPTGVNYTPLELEQYRALADDPEEQVKFIERIKKARDDAERGFRSELKPTREYLEETYEKIQTLRTSLEKARTGEGGGSADIAAINAFQKLVDEGIVRGEDVALQQGTASLREQLTQWAQSKKTGELLDPELRNRMLATGEAIAKQRFGRASMTVNAYRSAVGSDPRLNWRNIWPQQLDQFFPRQAAQTGNGSGGQSSTNPYGVPPTIGG